MQRAAQAQPQVGTAVQDRVGQVLIRNLSVDKPPNEQYQVGDLARLRFVLFNEATEPDALTAITSPVASGVSIRLDRDCDGDPEQVRELRLRGKPRTNLPGTSDPSGPRAPFRIEMRVNRTLFVGESVPVTFTFRNAGSKTIAVPVERSAGQQYPDAFPACEPVT